MITFALCRLPELTVCLDNEDDELIFCSCPFLSTWAVDSFGPRWVGNMEAQQTCSSRRLLRDVAGSYTHVKLLEAAQIRGWHSVLHREIVEDSPVIHGHRSLVHRGPGPEVSADHG